MTRYEAPGLDDRRISDLWLSGTYQRAIVGADDAGIFDALAEAQDPGLAARLDLDERATGIVLRLPRASKRRISSGESVVQLLGLLEEQLPENDQVMGCRLDRSRWCGGRCACADLPTRVVSL